jgi:hypothetical protein
VTASDPVDFQAALRSFLNQLNQRFDLQAHPLREKDVSIQLDRSEGGERNPVYLIKFEFDLS